MSYSRKKLDLAGMRFGKLTAVRETEKRSGRTAWLCRCDCGSEIAVRTDKLRSGRVKSCGCGWRSIESLVTFHDGTIVEMVNSDCVRRNNTSTVTGVDWDAGAGMWRATICYKGHRTYLGRFRRFNDAVNARKNAENEIKTRLNEEISALG